MSDAPDRTTLFWVMENPDKAATEIERLRALMRASFKEGFEEGARLRYGDDSWSDAASWRDSEARKALEAQQPTAKD